MEVTRKRGAIAALATIVGASLAPAAQATPRAGILDGSTQITAGQRAFVHATVSGRWCAVGVYWLGGHARGPVRRVPGSAVKLVWTVPAASRNGHFVVQLRCAVLRKAARRAQPASLGFDVSGGTGRRLPIPVKTIRITRRDHSESLQPSEALLPGVGDPSAVSVALSDNTGGGGFATYLPFAQGTRLRSSQGPHGAVSHADVYNFDAVDLETPVGTPIHAGFSGVVARINTGCGPYVASCGGGYGNYIYLKAGDGTCAQMGHLSQVNVVYGQNVTQYDVIGFSGVSGHTGGAHLHYNRVDCMNNRSLPWTPAEGGSLAEGSWMTSQNHPPETPCTALQGGCGTVQGSSPTIQGSTQPIQGSSGGQGGGALSPPPVEPTPPPPDNTPPPPPAKDITIGWSGSHSGWIWMTLNGFATGSHQYTCAFASGGNQTFTLSETSSPQTWDNGHTCYDVYHGDTVWVTVEGVSSNQIIVP